MSSTYGLFRAKFAKISNVLLTALRTFTLPDVDGNLSLANDGEPNGFTDRTQATPTWSNATRTLTLTPVSTNFSIWSNGKHYLKETVSFQISDVEGSHYIYFDSNGSLTETTNFNTNLIDKWGYSHALYWDAVNKVAIGGAPFCEMHGKDMPASVHSYLHRTQGTKYVSGFGVVADATGNGSLASHNQFSVAAGVSQDEDIVHSHVAKTLTGAINGVYLSGTNWRQTSTIYGVLTTGSGRAAYNQNVAGNWQLTEVPNNNYVLTHLLAIPGVSISTGSFIFVVGQASYSTLASAQAAALTERNSIVTSGLPFSEFVWIATLISKTASGYANAVKSAFVQTSSGESYVNWLNTTTSSGGSASNHEALANLLGGDATGHYHLTPTEYTDFTDSGDSTLHYHASDRNLVNSTGTLAVTKGGTGTTTQFTSGSVVFAGANGVYSQNNAQLFWDNTNNRLGIGLSNPDFALTVRSEWVSSISCYRPFSGVNFGSAIDFSLNNSNNIKTTYAYIYAQIINSTATNESSRFVFVLKKNGSEIIPVIIDSTASAVLELSSTTSGFLKPRMTTTQRDAISSPAEGLEIYNTTTKKMNFYDGTAWRVITST